MKTYITPITGINEVSVAQVLCASAGGANTGILIPFASGDPETNASAD